MWGRARTLTPAKQMRCITAWHTAKQERRAATIGLPANYAWHWARCCGRCHRAPCCYALNPRYTCRALGALLWALLTGAPSPAAAWLAGASGTGASTDKLQAGLDACLQRALAALPPASQPSPAALVRLLRCMPSR